MNNLSKALIESSFTKKQALSRLEQVRQKLNTQLFTNNQSNTPTTSKSDWLNQLDPKVLSEITPTNITQVFTESKQDIEKTKLLIVYLAFDPEEEIVEKIGQWVKDNISKDILIEIKLSPNLIGGCALSYNGILKDYSIQAKINQNRDEVLKHLQSFKKNL